jgi:restriction system-associated AAA family ATPase
MKLLRVHIIAADTCGGLLDGLNVSLRSPSVEAPLLFEPLCLIGPNGAGKSQFLQVVGEIFQALFHAAAPSEERLDANPDLQFEVEYLIRPPRHRSSVHVRAGRRAHKGRRQVLEIWRKRGDDWEACDLAERATADLLPSTVVGYTSGDNETLSLPFLISRSGYAADVASQALAAKPVKSEIPDTRLMLVDYGTHLEVLVANLLLGTTAQRASLLLDARVDDLHSFRCVVQLAHSAVPHITKGASDGSARKGVQLTRELEDCLVQLRRCATCHNSEPRTETYTFDFLVTEQTRKAFSHFWDSALALYRALHKLAMLNDLAIPKASRERFRRDVRSRRFATRLPEPQDEDKVFRFERVSFASKNSTAIADYVSLSDGEHQLAQLLGTFCMVCFPNALFLLDEPESHFNPKWRVKFVSRLLDLPTVDGDRRDDNRVTHQDCLLTTHAPFVPSDLPRERVFIFSKSDDTNKVEIRHPDVETYGTTFDTVLDECFGVRPPIAKESLGQISDLMKSASPKKIRDGMARLGDSVEKVFLADRLRELEKRTRS